MADSFKPHNQKASYAAINPPAAGADLDSLGILGYLFSICRYLKKTDWEDIEVEYVMESLESLAEDLESLETVYLTEAPPGGRKVRDYMLDAIFCILNAMEEMAVFMEENDPWHLKEGLGFLNSADTIVESLLSTVSQGRMELAEFISAVKRGDIWEGMAAKISITDEQEPAGEEGTLPESEAGGEDDSKYA